MVSIEIDGKQLEVEANSMIIEAADAAGIYIPRFCYHKKLSVAANCRMCLVEVEKSRKPLPACATPVSDGMKVFTTSKLTRDAQQAVMEFLLINHPLDCPICDQGGQCELQDFSLEFGQSDSRYDERKRSVDDDNLGSLVATEMTRCIHCTRCVRFSREIAGVHDLGATGRGEDTQIGTYIEKTLSSEISGNIIDLCPVGALTSKPFLYSARAWELQQQDSIAAHDCLGSNIHVHTRRGDVMRVVPRENENINETWLSDRDRFSYTGLHSKERLRVPMIKQNGTWRECKWPDALNAASAGLQRIIAQHGAEQLGALAGANSTTEELYLLQRLLRELGSDNIDHRLRETDVTDQDSAALFPGLGISIEELSKRDAVLLIGSDIRHEQPLAAHRLRQGSLDGHKIMFVNPMALDLHFEANLQHVVDVQAMVFALAGVAKALSDISQDVPVELPSLVKDIQVNQRHQQIAQTLMQGEQASVILGAIATQHPQAALIRSLAFAIAQMSDASMGSFSEGANSAGAWLAGALPHRGPAGQLRNEQGLTAHAMLAKRLQAYLVYNTEPELDSADPQLAQQALQAADFVVVCSPFISDAIKDYANVILPIAPFSETSGTFINVEGLWQRFNAATKAYAEVRPGWKVLRVLGNLLGLADFEYISSEQVHDELWQITQHAPPRVMTYALPSSLGAPPSDNLQRLGAWPMYRVDNLVRRAEPLQATTITRQAAIYLHPQLAERLHLQEGQPAKVQQGGEMAELLVFIDERIAPNTVLIPSGYRECALGAAYGAVEVGK